MAINYTKVGWDTSKYVNPTNMNKMDNGIKAACDGVDALDTAMGSTNISTIGDGTVTGAISALKHHFGSGAGAANRLAFKEEITEITGEMWASIADGTFDKVHVGMHYTAPSGRTYYFADADYYIGKGDTEQTAHHMLVIEDEISHSAQHQTSDVTTGGATSSLIYTTSLPGMQGELENDFGAAHIKTQRIFLSNATSGGIASNGAWVSKSATLLNLTQIFGHSLGYTEGAGQYFNVIVRERQLSLFQAMPETIVARTAGTITRQHYWCDDVISASLFALVSSQGFAGNYGASAVIGVRRAFLIG